MRQRLPALVFAALAFASSRLPADAPDATLVLEWNEVALAAVAAERQPAPEGARTMAMVHAAILRGLEAADSADRAALEAATAVAARDVLTSVFPARQADFEAAWARSTSRIPDGPSKAAGLGFGRAAAKLVVEARQGDGSGAPNDERPRTDPGVYVPTALPVGRSWAAVRPWFLGRGAQVRPGAPPSLSSAEWARDYEEVRTLGAAVASQRTAEQTEVAKFWAIVGPVTWNPVVRSLVVSMKLDLVDASRMFALCNMAAMDAFIAVFDAKYEYSFWRPITAIRNGDRDDNDATTRDSVWQPLIDTPPHPEYPCAHCISSAAVGAVLEARFGAGEVPPISMTSIAIPGVTRRWTKISDYVAEVSDARVWAGVHYRNSTVVGQAMGRKIGEMAAGKLGTEPPR